MILDVRYCEDASSNVKAIDKLVMPEATKNHIKALIQKYSDTKEASASGVSAWKADIIDNKGEGQIFLLHGSPGVGKTFVSFPSSCLSQYRTVEHLLMSNDAVDRPQASTHKHM